MAEQEKCKACDGVGAYPGPGHLGLVTPGAGDTCKTCNGRGFVDMAEHTEDPGEFNFARSADQSLQSSLRFIEHLEQKNKSLQAINRDLVEVLEKQQAVLEMTRQAILSEDPQNELILRVMDMKRENAAAIARAKNNTPVLANKEPET